MKRLLLSIAGIGLLASLPHANAASLYETVKKNMEEELQAKDVEKPVAQFIAAIAKEREWGVTEDEVKSIVEGSTEVCSKHETLNGLGCIGILKEIQMLVSYENDIRVAGRRLQSIATSYELPVSEIPGRSSTLTGNLSGVVSMWKAGTGSVVKTTSGSTIPSIKIGEADKEKLQPLVDKVRDVLKELSDEERLAAVWKYQYGERLVRGDRAPAFPAPVIVTKDCEKTERRFVCKRWEDVENAMDALWTELRGLYGVKPTETVFYLAFPDDMLKDFPDDIIVWARMDKDQKHPAGDVGLQWKYPLKPVFPALTDADDKPILGGNYPPVPEPKEDEESNVPQRSQSQSWLALQEKNKVPEGSGLCTMTFAQRGYLCRPVMQASAEGCPKPDDADKDSITLVGCTFEEKEKVTVAGPDVCADITWLHTGSGRTASKTVCTPQTFSEYENTIGNNLCFIGQCVEQSLETHRVTGGRTTAGVQDAAFPNDNPLAGSPLGNFLTAPTAGQPVLPPYKPLQPVREFEAALCALVGLPISTPPSLCTIVANRRADSPLNDTISTVLSTIRQEADLKLTSADTAMLAESVGMRMGTDLYARNLRSMSKTLAEVLGVATKLLNDVKSIDFPTEMCPIGIPSPEAPPEKPE